MIRTILVLIKHDKWNRFQMIVQGFQYQIWLNIEQRLIPISSKRQLFLLHGSKVLANRKQYSWQIIGV